MLVAGTHEYIFIFKELLLPIIKEFCPDLILVSSGFDSARGDMLGGLDVLPKAYAYMT